MGFYDKKKSSVSPAAIGLITLATLFACQTEKVTPYQQLQIPADYVRNIDASEKMAGAIKKLVVESLLRGLKQQDARQASALFSPSFKGSIPDLAGIKMTDDGDVSYGTVSLEEKNLDAPQFISRLLGYAKGLTQVERVGWRVFHSYLAKDNLSVVQDSHFQFAGFAAKSESGSESRVELSGDMRIEMRRATVSDAWKITRLEWRDGHFTKSQRPIFRDIAALTGLRLHDSKENQDNVQRMIDIRRLNTVGGLTVLDYNQDGYADILATRFYKDARLFTNDGLGGFIPRPIKAIDEENASAKFYLSVDLDNDKKPELVSTHIFGEGKNSEAGLYVQSKGDFRRKRGSLNFDMGSVQRPNYEGIVACDVNGDQLLDLIFLGYDHKESGFEKFNSIQGVDGLRNLLFINQGKLKFSEEAISRGISGTQYSYVSECYDFDGDQDADLFIGNDYGQNNFYVNQGTGKFSEDLKHPLHYGRGFSMGFSMADYDNTGKYTISISNMYSHAGNRIIPLVDDLKPKTKDMLTAFAAGNALFEQENGAWTDHADDKRVALAEWAWGNIFFDYDNDMDKDLYVANGFTTHRDPTAPDF